MTDESDVRELALSLPETIEKPSYGTPGFRVKDRLFARLREEPGVLVIWCDGLDEKELLIGAEPEKFFTTPHYDGHPMVLVRLEAVDRAELGELLAESWRLRAPKRLAAAHPGPVMLRRAGAETISDREERNVVILSEREALTVTWSRYAPGEQGPGPHVHREHTDAFYILEGELTFTVGPDGEAVRVAAGGFVAVPPNVVHSFANASGAQARWLNFHAPDAGFAAYLRAARDGEDHPFDSFDPPADGGLPAAEAIVAGPGEGERLPSGCLLKGALPHLGVTEGPPDPLAAAGYPLDDGRVLSILTRTAAPSARRASPHAGPARSRRAPRRSPRRS